MDGKPKYLKDKRTWGKEKGTGTFILAWLSLISKRARPLFCSSIIVYKQPFVQGLVRDLV